MIEICPKCQSRNIRFIKNSIDEKICDDCCYYGRMIFRSELRDTIAENWFPPTFKVLNHIQSQPAQRARIDYSLVPLEPVNILPSLVTLGSLKRTGNRIVRDNVKKNSIVIDIKRRF